MYTVYKTTCLENGKFYIGVHKTDHPNDDYLGSGKLIKRAIEKYGREKFKKEILDLTEDAKEAFKKEAELVTKELVDSELCYNLKLGGEGGFDFINTNPSLKSCSKAGKIGGPKGAKTCLEKKIGMFDPNRDYSRPDSVKKVSDAELLVAYKKYKTFRKTLTSVGLAPTGGGVRRLKRLMGL